MNNKTYKVLDLFAGAGGFSLGFKRFEIDHNHPFEIMGAVEIDQNAANTLINALVSEGLSEPEARRRVICGDITLDETKQQLYEVCKHADIILGGPPCQSFSMIGPRSGDKERQKRFANDQRDNLFHHYIEIVKHYKPLFFVFENVRGIISKKNEYGEKYIDIITETFIELGYSLVSENPDVKTSYVILNAANYGVPQARERVFIIGNRLGIKNPYPVRTHCSQEEADAGDLLSYVTLKDAIADLPFLQPKITFTPLKKGLTEKDMPEIKKKIIRQRNKNRDNGTDPMPYDWEAFKRHFETCGPAGQAFLDFIKPKDKQTKITGHIARGQQRSDILLFRGMDEGMSLKHLLMSDKPRHKRLLKLVKYSTHSFKDKYKKLSWNKPCSTLFAHMQKDGNRFIHPDSRQGRTLTVREAARIQSFPDDYVFKAIGHVRFRYIGNAVPPLLAMAIARSVYNSLSDHYRKADTIGYQALKERIKK